MLVSPEPEGSTPKRGRGGRIMRSTRQGCAAEGSEGGLQIWPELHAFSQQQSEGIPDRKLREAASDSNGSAQSPSRGFGCSPSGTNSGAGSPEAPSAVVFNTQEASLQIRSHPRLVNEAVGSSPSSAASCQDRCGRRPFVKNRQKKTFLSLLPLIPLICQNIKKKCRTTHGKGSQEEQVHCTSSSRCCVSEKL